MQISIPWKTEVASTLSSLIVYRYSPGKSFYQSSMIAGSSKETKAKSKILLSISGSTALLILISSQTEEKRIKRAVEHEIDSSIFDLAFVSLLDPAIMEDW
jgi:hypothetical protein